MLRYAKHMLQMIKGCSRFRGSILVINMGGARGPCLVKGFGVANIIKKHGTCPQPLISNFKQIINNKNPNIPYEMPTMSKNTHFCLPYCSPIDPIWMRLETEVSKP